MLIIAAGIFGFIVWYALYGIECVINGATGGFSMPFLCLWDDIRFNVLGGWQRRLIAANGDEEWAAEFPGWGHFIRTHILLPFTPMVLVVIERIY